MPSVSIRRAPSNIQDRFQTGTTWKFKAIKLLNEKPAFIHTTCRIIIDLRKSQAQAMLQSTSFPEAPVPTCTIALDLGNATEHATHCYCRCYRA